MKKEHDTGIRQDLDLVAGSARLHPQHFSSAGRKPHVKREYHETKVQNAYLLLRGVGWLAHLAAVRTCTRTQSLVPHVDSKKQSGPRLPIFLLPWSWERARCFVLHPRNVGAA